MKDVSDVRRSAEGRSLERDDLDDNAFEQFERWFGEACDTVELEPNAMALCTVNETGAPSSRTVLLKYFDETGFVFFTNYASRKSADIETNDRVSMLFFWRELGRQIRIDGTAAKIPATESLKYFMTRPRGSQIGAWVSQQSSIVTSRSLLEAKFDEIRRKFSNKEVPLPSFWGGYRVVPTAIELWQGRPDRLHDRFLYTRQHNDGWTIERLAP